MEKYLASSILTDSPCSVDSIEEQILMLEMVPIM